MGFSRQEYWSGLPLPSLGDLLDPGIESVSLKSPALQVDSLPLSHEGSSGEPLKCHPMIHKHRLEIPYMGPPRQLVGLRGPCSVNNGV